MNLTPGVTRKSPQPPLKRGRKVVPPLLQGGGGDFFSLPLFKGGGGRSLASGGFTLIEIIMSILLIGISVPAILTAFSGMKSGKNPEFAVQASFIAQKQIESILSATSPSCTGISTPDGAYTLACATVPVTAADPDTDAGAPDFGTKLTLTVGRTDGQMAPIDFFALF